MGSPYEGIVRPLAFHLSAELTHQMAPAAFGYAGRRRAKRGLIVDDRLSQSIGELRLRNPIGLAAGFDKRCRYLADLSGLGFGYVVGGTVTAEQRSGNPTPRVTRAPASKSILNAMGFPGPGAAAVRENLSRLQSQAPTLISISDASYDDLARTINLVAPLANGFEINPSCPNVAWGRDRETESVVRKAIAHIASLGSYSILVKIPPYHTSSQKEGVMALASAAYEAGAHGITASNTHHVPAPRLAPKSAGVSGRTLFPHTLRMIRDLYHNFNGRLTLHASGGVMDFADALACIRAGATTVQIYSALVYHGPGAVKSLLNGIRDHLDLSLGTDPQASIADLVGLDA